MEKVLKIETNKYTIKTQSFEGPLDLLCHLIDKNKMNIYDINISEITEQYIDYLNEMEDYDLEIASEFIIMASTLLYIKSKSLLPKIEVQNEISEQDLINRIIEYKKYKFITSVFRENFETYSKTFYKLPDVVEFPKQKIEKKYSKETIPDIYGNIVERNKNKMNINSKNIERIAMNDNITLYSKVKEIFKELFKKSKFVFGKLFSTKKRSKLEVITAFMGVLELSRRNKIKISQPILFGDIIVEKIKK